MSVIVPHSCGDRVGWAGGGITPLYALALSKLPCPWCGGDHLATVPPMPRSQPRILFESFMGEPIQTTADLLT